MNCPICKKEVSPNGRIMPFCSERCKLMDLGNWASEKYVIPAPAGTDPEAGDTNEGDE
ncbi:MAG: DNA gyrase inhibitor YacG [Bryobacteraceae bacterium]